MTDSLVPPQDGPQELLSASRRLTRRVRQAQRGTWFPLLLFAALTLASIPITLNSRHPFDCRVVSGGKSCVVYSSGAYVYWPVALVLAYAAIAAFYTHRARSRGVGTRIRPYVITGIIIAAVVTGASLAMVSHPELFGYPAPPSPATLFLYRLASPETGIGLALLVLAWVERNRALLVFGLLYLVIAGSGRFPPPHATLTLLEVTAAVLLLGSIGFALAEQHARRPAP